MRKLPLLTGLLLITCVRSQVSPPPRREYDESIKFPKILQSGGAILGKNNEKLIIDGAILQAMMIAAQDFIPPGSGSDDCFTKPGDFYYDVFRDGDIIFVGIHPSYLSCESGLWPMDWGAKYAISTDGRILRRAPSDEPDAPGEEIPSPSSTDAGENGDGGYRRLYDLSDFDRMDTQPVDNPPFFTRPEWIAQHPWPPSRKPHASSSPDGGTPDGGTLDGGFRADGGAPAIPPK